MPEEEQDKGAVVQLESESKKEEIKTEIKTEEKPDEGVEEVEADEEGDHPIDLLGFCVEDIDAQERRLRSKNPTNLKVELQRNVYPILKRGFAAIQEWMMDMEDFQADSTAGQMEEAVKEATEEALDVCEKIKQIDKNESAKEILGEDWNKITKWADKTIEQSKKVLPH